ncbi:MAG: hypothetical protein ACW98Y_07265 [Candidatus Thorarchaeota archaeon]
MKESKKDRFVRVIERRTNAVLEKIRVLGNCSNRSMYEYELAEVEKVFRAIRKALKETEQMFKDKESKKFKLST